ncbi:fasciclin-like arabinogalactan protein 21 [Euphorbia lathyris]|uniref:fasciclin-like arabinogalactan protein 21 n=1 Tax=Euphorbia lathyris TaxID=212925 RepID=UPI00331443DE
MASNSKWWHAPLFITVSVVLAFIAITTAIHSPSEDEDDSTPPSTISRLSHNASLALRSSGYNIMATLLHLSPEIFLLSSHSTIFAVTDSALINASLPSWFLKHLLQYHTSPLHFSMDHLFNMSQGTCIPTLVHRKNLAITMVDAQDKSLEINGVVVSDPDLFLDRNIAIHGVFQPFANTHIWDSVQQPICTNLVLNANGPNNLIEWTRMVRLLSSNGFVSFAIGLNSVLLGILQDYRNLTSVTIFGPPELEFVASSSPMLEKIVRLHILSRRYTYTQLARLPHKTLLQTLLPDQQLEITRGSNVTLGLAINGVQIVAPEIFSSNKFVFHAISRAFEVAELPSV